MLRGPGPFGDLADDAAAGSAGNFLLDRADAEVGRGRERLNLADDALWRTGPPKMPAARLSGPHTGGDALAGAAGAYVGASHARHPQIRRALGTFHPPLWAAARFRPQARPGQAALSADRVRLWLQSRPQSDSSARLR